MKSHYLISCAVIGMNAALLTGATADQPATVQFVLSCERGPNPADVGFRWEHPRGGPLVGKAFHSEREFYDAPHNVQARSEDRVLIHDDGRVEFLEYWGPANSKYTSLKHLTGRLNAAHTAARLDGQSRLIGPGSWHRQCAMDVSFDSDPLSPAPSGPSLTIDMRPSPASVQPNLPEFAKDQLKKDPTLPTAARLNAEADVLKIKLEGFGQLAQQLRTEFEAKTEASIADLNSKLSALQQDPTSGHNSEEIGAIKALIKSLQAKALVDDPIYASLSKKIADSETAMHDAEAAVRAEISQRQASADLQRARDLQDISDRFVQMDADFEASQKAMNSRLDAFATSTQTKLQMLDAALDQLNARTTTVEKQNQALAGRQTELAHQQAKTAEEVNATREILRDILLPVSEKPGDWMMRVAAAPVQQQQFCRVIDTFYDQLSTVYQYRNEIKKNALYRERQEDLASLLPNGAINSWVVRVVEVTQAADGSAAVMLQPPCRAMLGSDACAAQDRKIRATIPSDSLMYRELARVNTGDFVTISGVILYAQAPNTDSPLPSYAVYEPKKHCSSVEGAREEDVFVTQLSMLAVLR